MFWVLIIALFSSKLTWDKPCDIVKMNQTLAIMRLMMIMMSPLKKPRRHNLILITLFWAVVTPVFFEILNWITGFILDGHGIMDRWPIFVFMLSAFIVGARIQQYEYIKPDFLMTLFLAMCWIFAFFVSYLVWESILRKIPQGIEQVQMVVVLPTIITSFCFWLGLGIRRIIPRL